MLILTIRTDKPEAEIGLFDDQRQIAYEMWYAHRELSITLHNKIAAMLEQNDASISDLSAIAVFAGPGSFTGLRIGLTVGNAFAYALAIPIVATQGDEWIVSACKRLQAGENDTLALPEYGAPVHITQQKK